MYTNWYPITSGWNAVEIDYEVGTSGSLTLYINGTSQQSLTNVNNGAWTMNTAILGVWGNPTTTHGTLYFDSFESRRFSVIGMLLPPDLPPAQVATLAGWVGNDYAYDPNHPHAASTVTNDSNQSTVGSYTYDVNGNMTCRMESSSWFIQTYNAENRLSVVQKLASGNCSAPGTFAAQWNFSYDGDGTRAAQSYIAFDSNGDPGTPVLTEYFMGGLYEMSGSQVKKYYAIAGMTIAMNDGTGLKYPADRPARFGGGNDRFDRNLDKPTALFALRRSAHGCGFDHADRLGLHRPAQPRRTRQCFFGLDGLQCPHVRSLS